MPADNDELFVVSHENPAGAPVRLTVREMTAADVLDALEWHEAELARLWEAEKPHAAVLAKATEPVHAATHAAYRESRLLQRKITEQKASGDRLLKAVLDACPEQFRHLSIRESIGLWWPNH